MLLCLVYRMKCCWIPEFLGGSPMELPCAPLPSLQVCHVPQPKLLILSSVCIHSSLYHNKLLDNDTH